MRRWLTAVAILLLSAHLDSSHADTQKAKLDRLINQAAELSTRGKYEEAIAIDRRALALAERAPGRANADLTRVLIGFASHSLAIRKYKEAEDSLTRALAINKKAFGADDARNVDALYRLGELYRQQERFPEAEPLLKRALTLQEKQLGLEDGALVPILNSLGLVCWSKGRYAEAETFYKRGLSISAKAPVSGALLESLNNNLAILTNGLGRYKEAESFYRKALATAEKSFGTDHPEVGRVLTNFSIFYWAQGLYSNAEPLLQRALTIREKALGQDHPDVAHTLNTMGLVYAFQGRYAEAEPLYKRAIAIDEKAFGPEHSNLVSRLSNLADLYRREQLYAEAEPLYKRALDIAKKLGPQHPLVAAVSNNLAWVYWAEGRYGDAEPLYRRAIATTEQTLGSEHPNLLTQLHNLAALYRVQGRFADAEPLLLRAIALGEKVAPKHPHLGKALDNLALVYTAQHRYGEAEALFKRAIALAEEIFGPAHADVAAYANDLGALYVQTGEWAKAVQSLGRGAGILIERTKQTHESLDQARGAAVPADTIRSGEKLRLLVKASFRLAEEEPAFGADLMRRAFEIVQWAQSSEAASSIAQMAVRGASGDAVLSRLVREKQDLIGEWQARDKLLTAAISKPAARRLPAAEDGLRKQIEAIGARLAEIQSVLARDFPDYAALENPEPLSVDEIQAFLRLDEALVLFLDTPESQLMPEETFTWVITKTDARWQRSNVGSTALATEIAALRCGLDPESWDGVSGEKCAALLKRGAGTLPEAGALLPFDFKRAHALYTALFGESEELIKGKGLLLVPSGPLTQLPFQVLVTKPSVEGAYNTAAWLPREHALTVLPAVPSLKALRRLAPPSAAAKPMIGFGNPLLNGNQNDAAYAALYKKLAELARENQRCRELGSKPGGASRRVSIAPVILTKSGLADPDFLRAQSPLPETANELCAVARGLHADAGDVYLGARATEHKVKALSASGALAQYRIVHFATHGALAGQVYGTNEPGLLLTPPSKATDDDDGYLSAPEIAALKLDADWVILSACNTAAGGSSNAEALSGLARAFFYAQARALLVSHWAVDLGCNGTFGYGSGGGNDPRQQNRPRRGTSPCDARPD